MEPHNVPNLMLDTQTPELQFALPAVRQASLLARTVQAELVSPALTKDDRSPVTVADFAAQALVARRLMDAFPEALLVAEEDSGALRSPENAATLAQVRQYLAPDAPDATSEDIFAWLDHGKAQPARRFWTLDPVDGTKGFLRGGQYAVALALIEDGEVQLGLLGCPHLTNGYAQEIGGPGSLVVAVRGAGTWVTSLEGEDQFIRLHVSSIADPAQARLLRSFEAGHTNVGHLDQLAESMGVVADPVLMDSQAKYAILAAGHGDLLFRLLSPKLPDYREKIWDQAAGSLVVQEAGGVVTDLDGKPLDFAAGRTLTNNRGVLASNGHLHPAALEALRRLAA